MPDSDLLLPNTYLTTNKHFMSWYWAETTTVWRNRPFIAAIFFSDSGKRVRKTQSPKNWTIGLKSVAKWNKMHTIAQGKVIWHSQWTIRIRDATRFTCLQINWDRLCLRIIRHRRTSKHASELFKMRSKTNYCCSLKLHLKSYWDLARKEQKNMENHDLPTWKK